jgi:hypothetical protein
LDEKIGHRLRLVKEFMCECSTFLQGSAIIFSVKAQCEGKTRQRPEGDVKTTLGGFKGCLGFEL